MNNNSQTSTSQESLRAAVFQLVNAAYKVAPGLVIVGILLAVLIISITLLFSPLRLASLILLVVFTALLIFIQRESFGDATLSLVGGLLTVLRTEWTINLYITFCVAWLGFALMVFLISSIKLATRQEDILKSSAIALSESSNSDIDTLEKELNTLVKSSENKILSPIQRAEVIQLLVFRKAPKKMLPQLLKSVEKIFTITKVDLNLITTSLVDLFKMKKVESEQESIFLLDRLYKIIKDTPVAPQDFFEVFVASRRLLLQKTVSPIEFLNKLSEYLEIGVAPKDMYNEILNSSNIK
ncbi:hypothetical protein [Microcoleus sp. EPA2]|uniref:hypothetical protein n=2 Tax=unclassified Microcoleus TaxID=2642155 RepID=UPI00312BAC90